MENLGPQFVHVMNGYKYRLFAGSNSSALHSLQIAKSGVNGKLAIPESEDSLISKVPDS